MFICFHHISPPRIEELRLQAKYSPAEVDCSWASLLNAMVHKIHYPGFGLVDSGDAEFLHQHLKLFILVASCSSYKFLK